MDTEDRRRFLSVAVSFGDVDRLTELGFPPVALCCPACGAEGTGLGDPDGDFRLEGFEAISAGGIAGFVARCTACDKEVALSRRGSPIRS